MNEGEGKKSSAKSKLEDRLWTDLGMAGLQAYFRRDDRRAATRFHATRGWRFDLYSPELKLAVEVDGATFAAKGRHSSGAGLNKDYEKVNEAAIMGIRVLHFDHRMIMPPRKHRQPAKTAAEARRRERDGTAVEIIRRAVLGETPAPLEPEQHGLGF